MSCTYRLFFSVDEINFDDWNTVPGVHENAFMQDGFMRAVEISMRATTKCCYAIFYDAKQTPVACACYSRYVVDGAELAPGRVQQMIQSVQRIVPPAFKFKVLLCGLPVSTGSSNLVVAPDADMTAVTQAMDAAAKELAHKFGCVYVAFKEFDQALADRLQPLQGLGYQRATSVITYVLDSEFTSFDDYYKSRSKRTRANMRKVLSKFDSTGLRCEFLQGKAALERLQDSRVHELYMAVFRRSDMKFEVVPPEFFQELARQLPEQSRFTLLYRGDTLVAFCCGVQLNPKHLNLLYCGVDYDLNVEADLYFNLLYKALEDSFTAGATRLFVGQSADEFKQRLGCVGSPRFIYIKALSTLVSPLRAPIFRRVFPLVFKEPDFSKLHPVKDEQEAVPTDSPAAKV